MIELTINGRIKLREYLKAVMSIGTHQLVFEKVNGDVRVMQASRDQRVVGKELFESYVNTNRVESDTALPVFDTEANAWRSFKLETLIAVDSININEILKRAQVKIEEEQQ